MLVPGALLRWNRGRSAGRSTHPGVVRSTRRVAAARSEFAGFRFPPEVITLAVRWYVRYSLSYRDVEELLAERGIEVDHTTLFRWVVRFTPLFVEAARPVPAHPWGPVVRRRDVCEGRRQVALPVPGGRPVRPGHRRAGVTQAGQESGPAVLHPGAGRRHLADGGDHRSGTRLPAHSRGHAARRSARHREATRTTGSRPTTAGSRPGSDPCAG